MTTVQETAVKNSIEILNPPPKTRLSCDCAREMVVVGTHTLLSAWLRATCTGVTPSGIRNKSGCGIG